MKHIWSRITLEHTRQDGDDSKAPWYALPLGLAVVAGLYAMMQTLDATGF
ncbi:hypothetical protein H0A71_06405 [Alcaligenaceae bacterium]|nr:hypothetical protein [Alcaligenaceae bacterium]